MQSRVARSFDLDGRVALVTGSGKNIGRAIAILLAAAGAQVVVNGSADRAALDATVDEIRRDGGEAIGFLADVSRDDEVQRLVEAGLAEFGHLDIVVSNVGRRPYSAFLEITPAEWDAVLHTNLYAHYYLARHSLPSMLGRGFGRFIFISGVDGFFGNVTHRAHNVTAKAATHGLAMALAREFGGSGITANTVAPGPIDTQRDWSQYGHLAIDGVKRSVPLNRYGTVDEVAAACLFLASPGGSYVSGQVVHVNGGQQMY